MSNKREEKLLKRIENMMIKSHHLSGQHYKDEYWENIVKGHTLDFYLLIKSLTNSKPK